MRKFKQSLIALLGTAAAIGLATFAVPQTTRGTQAGGKEVFVTNAVSSPVPVAPQGTTQVAGGVAVTNTPTVSAQQQGPWSVAVAGTPSFALAPGATVGLDPAGNAVQVANSSANPIPVVSVGGGPPPEPFQTQRVFDFVQNGSERADFRETLAEVPAGKLLIVERVAARAKITCRSCGIERPISVKLSLGQGEYFFHFTKEMEATPVVPIAHYVAGESIRAYKGPGAIIVEGERRTGDEADQVQVSLSGYVVDAPPPNAN